MMHRTLVTLAAAATLVAGAALAPRADAQLCFGDDNLSNGQCWQPTQANLPQFPGIALPGLGVCWKGCDPNQKEEIKVEFSPPVQTVCSEYVSDVRVTHVPSGVILLIGKAVLNYTRTWGEVGPNNVQYQVWRMVAKADLTHVVTPGTPPTCYAPLAAYPSTFFYGYVDYARRCAAGAGFENSLVLWTGCDFLQHRPGISDFPGVALPDLSMAVVAPHTSANPFVPMNLPAPGGVNVDGAVRNLQNPLAPVCTTNERLGQGAIAPVAAGCLCPLSPVPMQQTLSVVSGVGTCPDATGLPSSFASQAIGFPNVLPWFHLIQTSIGTWSTMASYPGQEAAWVNEGLFRTHDSCGPADFFEVYYGSTTAKGYPVLHPVALSVFTDLADNWTVPLAGPYTFPLVGSIRTTDRVIFMTTP
ncbi:MAG: hypothetical protein ACF8XB_06170 [Planctomycetota bacterium JB042]